METSSQQTNNLNELVQLPFAIAEEISLLLGLSYSQPTSRPCHVPESVLRSIVKYKTFLQRAVIDKEINPDDDENMLKEFLKSHNLYIPFDVEKFIDPGDIVEIYCEDLIQIYRNKNFFRHCSYDLYTLMAHPFNVLFRRDQEVTDLLVRRAMSVFEGMNGIERIGCPGHHMQEHFARNSRVFLIEQKWISPIFSNETGKTMAFFCSQKAKPIGESNVSGIGFINH